MPSGNKVGDAYIEVHPELDASKINAQMEKLAIRLEKRLGRAGQRAGKGFSRGFNSEVNQLTTQVGNRFDSMFNRIQGAQSRHHTTMLAQQKEMLRKSNSDIAKSLERQDKLRRHFRDRMAKVPPLPSLGGGAEGLPSAPRGGGARGAKVGRPGRNDSFGQGLKQVGADLISILPGQLEGVFKNPYVAAVVTTGIAAVFTTAMGAAAGGIGAAAGVLGVGAATAFLAAADPAFKKATEQIGESIQATLLARLQTVKPFLMGMLQVAKDAINNVIEGIDVGPLKNMSEQFSKLFKFLTPIITNIVNKMLEIGQAVMPTILAGVEMLSEAFSDLLDTASQNKEFLKESLRIVLGLAIGAIELLNWTIKIGAQISKWAPLISPALALMNKFTKASGFGELEIEYDNLQTSATNAFAAQGQGALDAAGKLLTNTDAAKDAAAAQAALNQQIADYISKTSAANTSAAEFSNELIEMKRQLKETHGTVKLGTKAGNDNIIMLDRMAKSAADTAQKLRETGATTPEVAKKFDEMSAAMLRNAGRSKEAKEKLAEFLRKYREGLGLPPIDKKVNLSINGLSTVKNSLEALRNTKVTIPIYMTPAGETISSSKLRRNIEKQSAKGMATGGKVRGPGSTTSDSIPTMLSDEEYVIKAKTANKLGTPFLDALNETGKPPVRRSRGGSMGSRSVNHLKSGGKATVTKTDVKNLVNLNKQMALLTKTIEKQTAMDQKFQQKIDTLKDVFNSYVNLGAVDLEGKTTGNVLSDLFSRAKQARAFAGNLESLKKKGFSEEALDQVIQAGPGSALSKMLLEASKADVAHINSALKDAGMAEKLAATLNPQMEQNRKLMEATEKLRKTIEKQIFILEDRGVGSKLPEQKHAGGTTVFTPSQIKIINAALLKAGEKTIGTGSIRVEVGGKEVDTIIRKVNTKDNKPKKRATRSGGRRR